MRVFAFLLILLLSMNSFSREWKCLKAYQKETQKKELSPSDWLKSDRKNNTKVWMNANAYNLSNIKPEEYTTYNQRKDFLAWIDVQLKSKGHEVVWPSMAYFICNKFRLLESFPYHMLTNRKMRDYAKAGSEVVFKNSFEILKQLYDSDTILKNERALEWDKQVLHDEQFVWIQSVYETMDEQSTKRVEKIAKGRGIYGLFVPKAVRFEGDISDPKDRYEYALNKLYSYCKYHHG